MLIFMYIVIFTLSINYNFILNILKKIKYDYNIGYIIEDKSYIF